MTARPNEDADRFVSPDLHLTAGLLVPKNRWLGLSDAGVDREVEAGVNVARNVYVGGSDPEADP